MIVISMVLVVVGFVTLMLGVLDVTEEPLNFVYTSIGACILAGVFLIAGVLRSRPSRKGAPPSPAAGAPAPGPGGVAAPGGSGQQTETLPRDGASTPPAPPAPPSTPSGPDPGSRPLDSWRPQTYRGTGSGPTSRPPAAPGPTRGRFGAKQEPEPEPEPDVDDELEDVGEETEVGEASWAEAAADEGAVAEDEGPVAETPPAVPKKTAKKAAKKSGTKRAGAKKATKKAGTKKSAAKKAGTKKAGAKKATKKASAKKQAQASAAQEGDETRRIAQALSGVQGCGLAKHRKLAERFGNYEGLTEASVAQIAEVEGVSQALAQRIHDQLHS